MTGRERERWARGDGRRPPSIVSSQSIHVGPDVDACEDTRIGDTRIGGTRIGDTRIGSQQSTYPNVKPQTSNSKRQTTNLKLQTANLKQKMVNAFSESLHASVTQLL